MRVGILGAGNVGGALGAAWAHHGHEVFFGTRNPASPEIHGLLERSGPRARAESLQDAVNSSEVVLNALPWSATRAVLESLDFGGKPLLDCTNPLKPDLSGLEAGTTTSGGELVAQWARSSKVVKIFNTTGYKNMVETTIRGEHLPMLYCGDDADSKKIAASLAHDLGLHPIDAGPLSNSRLLEPYALVWIWLALKGGMDRDFAFQIVKR